MGRMGISWGRWLAPSSPPCRSVLAEALAHRLQDLNHQRLAALDGVAKLLVAHHEQPAVGHRGHGRGRQAAVDHADLAEEFSSLQHTASLAVDFHLGLSGELHVKGVAGPALAREDLAGRDLHLIAVARDELELLAGAMGEKR